MVIFLVGCFFVYKTPEVKMIEKKRSLQESLKEVGDYQLVRTVPLADAVQDTLELDDYIFADYESSDGAVNLYIGYYFSAAKMSAAHSPLVCLPGQGWSVGEPVIKQMIIGDNVIKYAEIEASIQGKTDLVLYWYQASLMTSPHVFRNKMNTFYNKYMQKDEQHAFVRVTVSLPDVSSEGASAQAKDFIRAFYPQFIGYMSNNNSVGI